MEHFQGPQSSLAASQLPNFRKDRASLVWPLSWVQGTQSVPTLRLVSSSEGLHGPFGAPSKPSLACSVLLPTTLAFHLPGLPREGSRGHPRTGLDYNCSALGSAGASGQSGYRVVVVKLFRAVVVKLFPLSPHRNWSKSVRMWRGPLRTPMMCQVRAGAAWRCVGPRPTSRYGQSVL